MRYWCSGCQKEVPESQTEWYHSLGRMCKLCRSGRVVPIKDAKP